jgi:hypothetical protein
MFETVWICVLQRKIPKCSYPTYIIKNTPTQQTLQRMLWPSPTDVSEKDVVTKHTHGLHLNSRGNKRLTQLIADSFVGGNASGIVITHSRVSPILT